MAHKLEIPISVLQVFKKVRVRNLSWVILQIEDNNISLVKTGKRSSSLDECQSELGSSPCYIFYSYDYTNTNDYAKNGKKSCLISYRPYSCTDI